MRATLFSLSAAVVLLFLSHGASATAQTPSRPSLGINYLYYGYRLVSMHDCKAQGEPRTDGLWVLPSYGDPKIRATAVAQMRAMRAAGFTTMRTIVFHGHDTDPDPTAFVSMDGRISAADKRKLHDFVSDVAAAGFTTLELAPDFGAENWLYCRNKTWGDCFDVRRTGENWRFIRDTAATALTAAGTMTVRLDLANEQAPDPHMPPRALAQAKTYLQTLAGRFARAFGSGWVISAARSQASSSIETSDRVNLLLADLAQAGLVPKYIELHDYSGDGNDMTGSLDALQSIARRTGTSIVLGELRYHSSVQAAAIAGWLAKHPDSRIVDIMQWPEWDPSIACAIDPSPPYSPGPLGRLLKSSPRR